MNRKQWLIYRNFDWRRLELDTYFCNNLLWKFDGTGEFHSNMERSIYTSSIDGECTADKVYFDINKSKAISDDFKVKILNFFSPAYHVDQTYSGNFLKFLIRTMVPFNWCVHWILLSVLTLSKCRLYLLVPVSL